MVTVDAVYGCVGAVEGPDGGMPWLAREGVRTEKNIEGVPDRERDC